MPEGYYRTGQAAEILGISSNDVRRLLESGLMDGDYTGKQWRIPVSEVERVKEDGVPPIPKTTSTENPSAKESRPPSGPPLLGPPSSRVADSAEEAMISGHEVTIAQNRLERLRIRKEAADLAEFFENHERREDERAVEEERRLAELEAEQRRERAAVIRAQRTQEFQTRWMQYALKSKPVGAPPEVQLEIRERVSPVIGGLEPATPDAIVRPLVDAAIAKATRPWTDRAEKERAIQTAYDGLHYKIRCSDQWATRARQLAASAVASCRPGAHFTEMVEAARASLRPIIAEHEHLQRCERCITWVSVPDANSQDRQDAAEAVRQRLRAVPVGASERDIEKARDEALAPIHARIRKRLDAEMRAAILDRMAFFLDAGLSAQDRKDAQEDLAEAMSKLPEGTSRYDLERERDRIAKQYAEEHRRKQSKENLILSGLRHIYTCLQAFEAELEEDDGEFDVPLSEIRSDMEPIVREALEEELDGDESTAEVQRIVMAVLREELEMDD